MSEKNLNMPNDFMQKLVNAKKIMNKVDSGDYEKGYINKDVISADPENLMTESLPQNNESKTKFMSNNPPSPDKIKQSKLPDAIKQAMIDNPIPSLSLNEGLDIDIFEGAKRLMEKEGLKKSISTKQQTNNNISTTELTSILTPIIENIVRKTITEILDKKLTQILTAQETKTINENLVLKVGNSIFKGNITGVKKTK